MSVLGTDLILELASSLEPKTNSKKSSVPENNYKQDSDADSFISLNHNQPNSIGSSKLKDLASYTLNTTTSLVQALSFGVIRDEEKINSNNHNLQSITLDINQLAYLQQEFENKLVQNEYSLKSNLEKSQQDNWSLSESFNGWFGPKHAIKKGEDLLSIYKYLGGLEKLKVGPYDQRIILTSTDGSQWKFKQPVSLRSFPQLTHLTIYRLAPHRFVGWYEVAPNLIYLACRRSIPDPDKLLLDTLMVPEKSIDFSQPLWPNLRTLDLSRNDLTNFGETAAFASSNCSRLSLANNRLSQVPEGLKELYKLNALDLSFNHIISASKTNYILGNISHLSLRGNGLTSLQGLHKLWALQHLDVSYNKINEVDEVGRLSNLPSLMNIDLEGNPLCDEPHYRIQVFKLFTMSENLVKVDGTAPQLTEKLKLRSDTGLSFNKGEPLAGNLEASLPPVIKEKKVSRRQNKGARRLATIRSIADIDGPNANQSTTTTRRTSYSLESNPDSQGSQQPARSIRFSEAEERQLNDDSQNASLAALLLDPKLRSVRPIIKTGRSSVSPKLDLQSNHRRAFSPPPSIGSPYRQFDSPSEATNWRAEDYRKRVEAMRNEAGTTWLKVFNEIQHPNDTTNVNLSSSLPNSWSQPKASNQPAEPQFQFTKLEPKVTVTIEDTEQKANEAIPDTSVEAEKVQASELNKDYAVKTVADEIQATPEIPIGTTFQLSLEVYANDPQSSPKSNSPVFGRWIVTETEILQLHLNDATVAHRYSLNHLMKCLMPTDKKCVRVEFKVSRYDPSTLIDVSGVADQIDLLYQQLKEVVSRNLDEGRLHDRYKQGKCLKCHWMGFLNDPYTNLTRRGGQFKSINSDHEPHCPKCNGTFLVEFYGREDSALTHPSLAANLVGSLTNLPAQASQTMLQSLAYANPAPYLGALLNPTSSHKDPKKGSANSAPVPTDGAENHFEKYSKLAGFVLGQPPFQALNNALRLHLDLSVLLDDDEQVLVWLPGAYLKQTYSLYDPTSLNKRWRLLHSNANKLPNQLPDDEFACRQVYLCLSNKRFYLFEPSSDTHHQSDPSSYLRLVKRVKFDSLVRLDVEPNRQALTFHFAYLKVDTNSNFYLDPNLPIPPPNLNPELALDVIPNFSIKLLTCDKLGTTHLLDSLLEQLYELNLTKLVNHDVLWAIQDLRKCIFLNQEQSLPVTIDGATYSEKDIQFQRDILPDPAVDSQLVVDKVTFDFLKFYGICASLQNGDAKDTPLKVELTTVVVTDVYLYLTTQRHHVWPPPLFNLNTFNRKELDTSVKSVRPTSYDLDLLALNQVVTKSHIEQVILNPVDFTLQLHQANLGFQFEVQVVFKVKIKEGLVEEEEAEKRSESETKEPEEVPLPDSPKVELMEEVIELGRITLLFTNLHSAQEFVNSVQVANHQ